MPPRPRVTDAELLEAARAVFLESGVEATTAAVAARAGVSEALVFKRFRTKEALFERAMTGVRPRWIEALEVDDAPFPDQLERIGVGLIEAMRAEMPRSMLKWSRNPAGAHQATSGFGPVAGMKVLSAWLEGQMRKGRIRPSDPEILARVFSGAIVAHAMGEMTGLNEQMPIATTTFIRGLVDALWRGARPDGAPRPPAPGRPA